MPGRPYRPRGGRRRPTAPPTRSSPAPPPAAHSFARRLAHRLALPFSTTSRRTPRRVSCPDRVGRYTPRASRAWRGLGGPGTEFGRYVDFTRLSLLQPLTRTSHVPSLIRSPSATTRH